MCRGACCTILDFLECLGHIEFQVLVAFPKNFEFFSGKIHFLKKFFFQKVIFIMKIWRCLEPNTANERESISKVQRANKKWGVQQRISIKTARQNFHDFPAGPGRGSLRQRQGSSKFPTQRRLKRVFVESSVRAKPCGCADILKRAKKLLEQLSRRPDLKALR
jgi:hypothetical protein